MILRTGVDIIEISRLENLQPALKTRFLERVFTPVELAESGGVSSSLAGRFAVKEAVAKALGCGIGPIRWRDIEVKQGLNGEPLLYLHGAADDMARQQGLSIWSISISHNTTQAIAMAVAMGMVTDQPSEESPRV
jgi:holo-[acyl-carrier protein] synthase